MNFQNKRTMWMVWIGQVLGVCRAAAIQISRPRALPGQVLRCAASGLPAVRRLRDGCRQQHARHHPYIFQNRRNPRIFKKRLPNRQARGSASHCQAQCYGKPTYPVGESRHFSRPFDVRDHTACRYSWLGPANQYVSRLPKCIGPHVLVTWVTRLMANRGLLRRLGPPEPRLGVKKTAWPRAFQPTI